LTENLIEKLGYAGIFLVLVLGGLGLPVPEELPIILGAVFSRKGTLLPAGAFAAAFAGVLVGDFVVYFLGYHYGEKVMSLPLTRKFLTQAREAQIKGYFHRHGFKILVLGRFAVGFRTAAYLTAGILKLPPLRLFLTDLVAASLSTSLMFGLGWVFARSIENGLREIQHWITLILGVVVAFVLLYRFYLGRKQAGRPIGPPVPYADEIILPPDLSRISHSELPTAISVSPAIDPPAEPTSGPPFVPEPLLDSEAAGVPPNGSSDEAASPEAYPVEDLD
jgi:membrane protein DedA with SNARE-associated domain